MTGLGYSKILFFALFEQAVIFQSTIRTRVSAALVALENICNTVYLIGKVLDRVDQTSTLLSSSLVIPREFTGM